MTRVRRSKAGATTSSCCASNATCIRYSSSTDRCRCHLHRTCDTAVDAERYQTVYAAQPGAVAAPTAGLHFTAALLDRLRAVASKCAIVTLHVGAGTFQPVRVQRLADHRMHSEWYDVPTTTARRQRRAARRRRVVAVGTTSLRALESAAGAAGSGFTVQPGGGDTSLFITPGYAFRVVDRLITNFHLPRSTLLMLCQRLCRDGTHPGGLCACDRAALPVLQLR